MSSLREMSSGWGGNSSIIVIALRDLGLDDEAIVDTLVSEMHVERDVAEALVDDAALE